MLAGKEITGKSSESVGGGEEVAGVLEAGVPFPPAQIKNNRQSTEKKIQGRHSGATLKKLQHTYS